jgi:uncharacterized protein (DUF58 family)
VTSAAQSRAAGAPGSAGAPPAPSVGKSRVPHSTGIFYDPAALMRIRNLELRARAVMQGFWKGIHRSPYHGFSAEFTEYRQYTPGDDPRYLDWKLYARSDRYYIRKSEEETNLSCFLLVDRSRSMDFSSLPYSKASYALTLAATFAVFLRDQGDAVGLLTFSDSIHDFIPARSRRSHLRALLLALERVPQSRERATGLDLPLERTARLVRRRGMIVVISDFLAPLDGLERRLATLAVSGHEVSLFHLADPAERTFDFKEAAVFRDLESDRELHIDPLAARADYVKRFEAHAATLRDVCRRLGLVYHLFPTDRHLEFALFEYVNDRMRSRRRTLHGGTGRKSR